MIINAYNQSRDRGFLAFLKHRRWWAFYEGSGSSRDRVTEDGTPRWTESGIDRVTEN